MSGPAELEQERKGPELLLLEESDGKEQEQGEWGEVEDALHGGEDGREDGREGGQDGGELVDVEDDV